MHKDIALFISVGSSPQCGVFQRALQSDAAPTHCNWCNYQICTPYSAFTPYRCMCDEEPAILTVSNWEDILHTGHVADLHHSVRDCDMVVWKRSIEDETSMKKTSRRKQEYLEGCATKLESRPQCMSTLS